MNGTVLELNTRTLVALVISMLLPIVVGLVTKQSWSGGLKAILLLALNAVSQFLVAWQDTADGEHFHWQSWLFTVVWGFVVSVASHYGLWKPTGATEAAQSSLVADPPTARNPIR